MARRRLRDQLGPLRYPFSIAYYLLRFPESARFAPAWLLSLVSRRTALQDEVPWIPYVARAWLSSHVTPAMRVFEFGSGGSTVFLARRARAVVSVEHDPEWCARLRQTLATEHLTNCTLILREPVRQAAPSSGSRAYASTKPAYAGMDFGEYVRTIDAYPDETFDLVFVDGRSRKACLAHAIPKVRVGGLLVLDNSDNREYADALRLFAHLPRTDLHGYGPYWPPAYWRTTVWEKIAAWKPGSVATGATGDHGGVVQGR